jgi:JmjC domain, hydroxylase
VLRSYSWSTNVCGRKRWFLVPPTATSFLYDCFGSRLATHLRADVGEMGHIFPGLELARSVAVEFIQEAGETIFVPSNVFHTVENLEPTLSINHNWINCHNVLHCWEHVRAQVDAAREAQRRAASGGECAQGMDDLNLLWLVVSDRSERVLRLLETEVTTELPSMLLARDAKASLLVLNGMLKMLSENQCSKDVLDSGPVFLLSKRLQSVLSCNRNSNTAE